MTQKSIHVDIDDKIAWIVLSRADKHNALSTGMLHELDEALNRLEADNGVGVLIVTGEGDKAFCAGGDITKLMDLDPVTARQSSLDGQRVMTRVDTFPKPVIAAVNGLALGGGCELALACHLRVASETAQFGFPETGLGFPPGFGGTQRLPRLLGRGVALDLLLTGEFIGAEVALAMGLVSRVFPARDFHDGVEKLAKTLLTRAPLALRAVLTSVREGLDTSLDAGLQLEASLFGLAANTHDFKEGVSAFQAKRRPRFKGN